MRLGSFTRAAEELGYTQSGLTHMMNSLEKDIHPALLHPAVHLLQECLHGAEALELLKTHSVNLMILDVDRRQLDELGSLRGYRRI